MAMRVYKVEDLERQQEVEFQVNRGVCVAQVFSKGGLKPIGILDGINQNADWSDPATQDKFLREGARPRIAFKRHEENPNRILVRRPLKPAAN